MSMSSLIDGEQIEGRLFKRTSNGSDSFLISCWSNVSPDMIFITIDDQDTDTLSFMSEYIEDECCSWYRLESVSVNGANTIPILNETVTLLK